MKCRHRIELFRIHILIVLFILLPAISRSQAFPIGWQLYHPAEVHESRGLSCAASANPKSPVWTVALTNNRISITPEDVASPVNIPIPHSMLRQKGMLGKEKVMAVHGGLLIGYDAGEFEGGLWFLPSGSVKPTQLLQQNVVSFLSSTIGLLVLVGTNHAGIDEGKVYSLSESSDGKWSSTVLADLHAKPQVVVGSQGGAIVVTDKEVIRLDNFGTLLKLGDIPKHLEPNSVVVDDSNDIYVGMSLVVIRLRNDHGGYVTDILYPTSCKLSEHVGKNGEDYCDCGSTS